MVAVIVHHGTAGGGHYTCYALNEPSSQWMEFDDSLARPVTVDTVANCQAYVLFYQKRRTNEMEDFRRHITNLTQQELEAQSLPAQEAQSYLQQKVQLQAAYETAD